MEDENITANFSYLKAPRKMEVIKQSKYETSAAARTNKKYWQSVFNEMEPGTVPSTENESRKLSEVLPPDLYEKVCHILNIPVHCRRDKSGEKIYIGGRRRRMVKAPLLSYRKILNVDREMESDTDVELSSREDSEEEVNIYQEFLLRPEREQVSWPSRYLQPEREDQKDLVRRSDDLTDRIAKEFCNYMKQLGGDQQSQLFTPKAIKDLFQVQFDTHVAQSLKLTPKELPAVSEKVATVSKNPTKSCTAYLERQIDKDIKAERRPDKVLGFGTSLPRKMQWHTPNNDTKNLWRSARHVPKDLVTLKTVWEGITNLRSVKEYCRWMISHPEYKRAPYLRSLGMFDSAVLKARLTIESCEPETDCRKPAPIDLIRRKLSEVADINF